MNAQRGAMRIHNCGIAYTKSSHNFKLFTLTYIHMGAYRTEFTFL